VTAPRALALSDKQLALLQRAAASLPVGEPDHFLQSVAAHLTPSTPRSMLPRWRGELEEEADMSMSTDAADRRARAA
jgi:hypothetical protein